MFSKRILHAGSALSVGLLAMKNGISRKAANEITPKINEDAKLQLIPKDISVTPKVLAQPPADYCTPWAAGFAELEGTHKMNFFVGHDHFYEFLNVFIGFDLIRNRPLFTAERLNQLNMNTDFRPTVLAQLPRRYYREETVINPQFANFIQMRDDAIKMFPKRIIYFDNLIKAKVERDLLKSVQDNVMVVHGPAYVYNDRRFCKYTKTSRAFAIYKDYVEKATHYYYILLHRKPDGTCCMTSYLFPYPDIYQGGNYNLEQHLCPVHVIEELVGHKFFPEGPQGFTQVTPSQC